MNLSLWIKRLDLKSPVLYISLACFIVQFAVYIMGFDHILTWWIYVTHHFVELPGFFFFGMWLGKSFFPSVGVEKAQKANFLLYFGWLFIYSRLDPIQLLAANLVQWPWILGFYFEYLLRAYYLGQVAR